MKDYFIKPGYVSRTRALTRETQSGEYWNEKRISTASFYQYEIYRAAKRELLRRRIGSRQICDVGCGYPVKLSEINLPVADRVVGIDQPTLVDSLKSTFPGIEFRGMDLESPEAADLYGSFDMVICADVIEHLLDPDPCVGFIRDLLRPDGIAVISTPERDITRGVDCAGSPKPMHVREWNAEEFARYVSSRGLRIIRHRLMPKGRLPPLEHILRPLLPRSLQRHGCQMVVCSPK